MTLKKFLCYCLALSLLVFSLSGCGGSNGFLDNSNNNNQEQQEQNQEQNQNQQDTTQDPEQTQDNTKVQSQDQTQDQQDTTDDTDTDNNTQTEKGTGTQYTATGSDEHAINANDSSQTYTYDNISVTKTGSSSGENSDFYGTNAAVIAQDGATLTITNSKITTNGQYANAVFCYGGSSTTNNGGNSPGGTPPDGNAPGGEPPAKPSQVTRISSTGDGSTVNISDSVITTSSNNSGGIMVTGGGVLNANDLTITTSGGSSAAIRSDRGGGTMTIDGGTYTTSGTGSPAIYCTADISVSGADLESKTAQGVVIEGSNSVTLDQCNLTANHNKLNGQDSSYQGIMIYQSGSGDASEGTGTFTMKDSSIINQHGAIFFVTNTTAIINLSGSTITNNDSDNIFLNAGSAAWGSSGSNGGKVTLTASNQAINGRINIDSSSSLALTLKDSSSLNGAVNNTNSGASISVNIEYGSTWTLTGNSYVTSLTNNGTINKGSYTLYVNGTAY